MLIGMSFFSSLELKAVYGSAQMFCGVALRFILGAGLAILELLLGLF